MFHVKRSRMVELSGGGVSRGTAAVMVLGRCWELGVGLLMECFT